MNLDASREGLAARLTDAGMIAVIRLRDTSRLDRVLDAIHRGGVIAVEITMTTPGALEAIRALTGQYQDRLIVGAGSVLDAATACTAVEAGAQFVVSPVFKREIVTEAHALGVPVAAGAFTPTEALAAHESGADFIKLFPANVLGIPFLKDLLAPMPSLRVMPTGGVTPDNVGDWLRAGAVAVGIGSALVDPALVDADDFAALGERARRAVANGQRARTTA